MRQLVKNIYTQLFSNFLPANPIRLMAKALVNFFYARSALNWILNEDWFLRPTRSNRSREQIKAEREKWKKARAHAKATCQETKNEINQRIKKGSPKQMPSIVIRDNGRAIPCDCNARPFSPFSVPKIKKNKTAPPRGPLLSKLIQMPERNTNN